LIGRRRRNVPWAILFLLGEDDVLWKENTGGKPVLVFPKDPAKAGWGG
jgi:hypothetical protein